MREVIVRYEDSGYGNVAGEIVEDLIRCKDCKFYEKVTEDMMKYTPLAYYCSQMDRVGFYDSDYCSRAEKKEEDEEIQNN